MPSDLRKRCSRDFDEAVGPPLYSGAHGCPTSTRSCLVWHGDGVERHCDHDRRHPRVGRCGVRRRPTRRSVARVLRPRDGLGRVRGHIHRVSEVRQGRPVVAAEPELELVRRVLPLSLPAIAVVALVAGLVGGTDAAISASLGRGPRVRQLRVLRGVGGLRGSHLAHAALRGRARWLPGPDGDPDRPAPAPGATGVVLGRRLRGRLRRRHGGAAARSRSR